MKDRTAFRVGLAGSGVTALCCVTPLAVWGLGAVGLGAAAAWLDWLLLPALAGFLGLTAVTGWRLWARRRGDAGPAAVTLLWFEGCPHAARARDQLQAAGVPFRDVRQDDLAPGHPHRGYTSPTVLGPDGAILWGSASGEAGCSVLPPEPEALLNELRRAGVVRA